MEFLLAVDTIIYGGAYWSLPFTIVFVTAATLHLYVQKTHVSSAK